MAILPVNLRGFLNGWFGSEVDHARADSCGVTLLRRRRSQIQRTSRGLPLKPISVKTRPGSAAKSPHTGMAPQTPVKFSSKEHGGQFGLFVSQQAVVTTP